MWRHTPERRSPLSPSVAAGLYAAVTIVFTWPLASGLTRDIPWDLGDSLLNAWILAWDADHLQRFLSGEFGALRGFWDANIFYPERLTLAYSEHLIAQAVQILPVYALTDNIILSYNLLFLSTFVLSGLGVYLFVREVTGSDCAGFVAGLTYAFAPYRVPQFSHLQVLSSQWMPLALYGFRRYFDTRRVTPLAGAAAALIAQNLSNGYFLLFFSPVVAAYVLFEIATRNLWRNVRVWTAVVGAAGAVALATIPFLLPYLELRQLGFPARSLFEVMTFSADVFSYWTAPSMSHVWGRVMRAVPRPEGELFPGLTLLGLTAIALWVVAAAAWRSSRSVPISSSPRLAPAVRVLLGICAIYTLAIVLLFSGFRFDSIGPFPISVRGIGRPALLLGLCLTALISLSPRARRFAKASLGTVPGFAFGTAAVAAMLSFGPAIRANGRLIGETGPYWYLYAHVAGFDGLRVPSRYAMLVILFLAIVGGYGSAALERRVRRGGMLIIALGLLAVVEGLAAPIVINGTAAEGGYATPPARVYTGESIPAVYRFAKTLPAGSTVLVEFPFGETGYEVRYMFYSTNHWHRLLNGYSGTFPLSYSRGGSLLRRPLNAPQLAWNTLRESGATHAIVHENLYAGAEGHAVSEWLATRGARQIAAFDGDTVFQLK